MCIQATKLVKSNQPGLPLILQPVYAFSSILIFNQWVLMCKYIHVFVSFALLGDELLLLKMSDY